MGKGGGGKKALSPSPSCGSNCLVELRRREEGKEGGERGDYSTERQEEEEEEEVRKKKKRPSSLSKENQLLNVVSANRGGKRRGLTDSARIYRLGKLGFSLKKANLSF